MILTFKSLNSFIEVNYSLIYKYIKKCQFRSWLKLVCWNVKDHSYK